MKTLTVILALLLPALVAAQVPTTFFVDVTWQDNSPSANNPNAEEGFVIERNDTEQIAADAWFLLVTLPANVTSHRDTVLAANHLYSYRVRSFNVKGYSTQSNVSTVTTPPGPAGPGGPPDVPIGLYADDPVAESTTPPTFAPMALNAGGGAIVGTDSKQWVDDLPYAKTFKGITIVTATITGAGDPKMLRSERFGAMTYEIPLPPGSYRLTAWFAETYLPMAKPGGRVFDVLVEGALWLDNFDIFVATGAANTGIAKSIDLNINDGTLNVVFRIEPGRDVPKVCGLEIIALQ